MARMTWSTDEWREQIALYAEYNPEIDGWAYKLIEMVNIFDRSACLCPFFRCNMCLCLLDLLPDIGHEMPFNTGFGTAPCRDDGAVRMASGMPCR